MMSGDQILQDKPVVSSSFAFTNSENRLKFNLNCLYITSSSDIV